MTERSLYAGNQEPSRWATTKQAFRRIVPAGLIITGLAAALPESRVSAQDGDLCAAKAITCLIIPGDPGYGTFEVTTTHPISASDLCATLAPKIAAGTLNFEECEQTFKPLEQASREYPTTVPIKYVGGYLALPGNGAPEVPIDINDAVESIENPQSAIPISKGVLYGGLAAGIGGIIGAVALRRRFGSRQQVNTKPEPQQSQQEPTELQYSFRPRLRRLTHKRHILRDGLDNEVQGEPYRQHLLRERIALGFDAFTDIVGTLSERLDNLWKADRNDDGNEDSGINWDGYPTDPQNPPDDLSGPLGRLPPKSS